MAAAPHMLDGRLDGLMQALQALQGVGPAYAAGRAWLSAARAVRFHLRKSDTSPRLVAVVGGTGTGKSTLVNRLVGREVTAASYRRTFTGGPIAVSSAPIAEDWLDVPHRRAAAEGLPVRGEADLLTLVQTQIAAGENVALIDTPDLDGDQPQHHFQADRVFRWAQAILFIVTPEKYQMTELIAYYRLAHRYGLPVLFVMNKCQEQAEIDDYAEQLAGRGFVDAVVYAVPRDDAGFEPPAGRRLEDLRQAIGRLRAGEAFLAGLGQRALDLVGRLSDQVVGPLRRDRAEGQRLLAWLGALEAPEAGVDVNPMTRELQRRLREKSILYLVGPERMLERVRQVPGLLARLPRTMWDVVVNGKTPSLSLPMDGPANSQEVPDFQALLAEQWAVVLSRIDDTLRSSAAGQAWMNTDAAGYQAARLDAAQAGKIAETELAQLQAWLQQRWNGTPRDTAALMRLLRLLPGGKKLADWSEAAPYLLVLVVVATGHALLGGLDLVVLGGWSAAVWLGEKLSNEVAAHTRATNRKIADDFAALAHRQCELMAQWISRQIPSHEILDRIESLSNELSEKLAQ